MSKILALFATGFAVIASSTAWAQAANDGRVDRLEYRDSERRDERYERDDRDRRYDRRRYDRNDRDRESYAYSPYVGVSAGWLNYDEEGLDTLSPTILVVRFGQQFTPYVGVEARLGTSIRGDETDDGFRINAQAIYAGYVKGSIPFSPSFSGYGLAGVAGVQLHRNYPESDTNDAGFSVGLGVEYQLGGGASLNAEWVRLTTGTNDDIYDYTADQLTFGVNWRW
jgi:opacity protein-like surface antigen